MQQAHILLLDDDKHILDSLRQLLQKEKFQIKTASNPNLLPELIQSFKPDVLLLDMNYSAGINTGNEGLYWLEQVTRIDPNLQVILLTAYGDYDLVVKGVKKGAFDFISKPWDNEKLLSTITAALRLGRSLKENNSLKEQNAYLSKQQQGTDMLLSSNSPKMQQLLTQVEKLAKTDANILILGENGTGKGVLAKHIHQLSNRSRENFVHVDLGSLSDNLFESELFGYEKGAYTDATNEKAGRFEWANAGCIFLDEIGNLPSNLQSKLLSVIQNREVYRLGSVKAIPLDIRLVCATNQELEKEVQLKNFRQDLFFRINTITLTIPCLRERVEDISAFAQHFLRKFGQQYAKPEISISKNALKALENYHWPGNIRELENTIEKAVILSDNISLEETDFQLGKSKAPEASAWPLKFEDIEKNAIIRALENNNGKLIDAATELGLTRQTIYNKCKKYNIKPT